MRESFKTRLTRWRLNFFPAYRGTGARITYIADDWREVRIKLPLNWRTRNYVGTIFGGSMYGAVDPIYMVMLIRILGPAYVVWDKGATIQFKRPGRSTLHACFILGGPEIDAIKAELRERSAIDRNYPIDLVDADGVIHATVTKTLHIRRREAARQVEGSRGDAVSSNH
jgi:acyl-coenzyme A thioesterase PaaI-like protein